MDSIWGVVVRRRRAIFAAALGLALAAWWAAPPLAYKQDVAAMFPSDDAHRVATETLRRVFGGEGVVLAVYRDEELLSEAGAQRQRALAESLGAVAGVETCFGLLTTSAGSWAWSQSRLGELIRKLATGFLLGPDQRTAAVVCLLDWDELDLAGRRTCIDALRDKLRIAAPEGVLAGEPVMLVDGYRMVENDGRLLLFATTGVLAGSTLFMFPSLAYGLSPLILVAWVLLASRAIVASVGMPMSMISSMVTAMTAILGVAAMMHVLVRRQSLAQGDSSLARSAVKTLGQLARPTAWAAATDAAAFMALWAIDVMPVQDYATMLIVASLMIPIGVLVVAPACTYRPPTFQPSRRRATRRLLAATLHLVHRRPWRIVAAMGAAAVFAAVGLPLVQSDTNFVRNFRKGSRLVKAYAVVESSLGGAATWDVLIPAPQRVDEAWMRSLAEAVSELRELTVADSASLTGVLALSDVVELLDSSPVGWAAKALPTEEKLQMLRLAAPSLLDSMIAVDPEDGRRYTRLVMRGREDASEEAKRAARNRVETIVQQRFPAATIAGLHVLLAQLVENLVAGQPRSCLIAAVAVWFMLAVALRGPIRAAAALAPNLLPPAVLVAGLGLLGQPINMGAAMIAAVAVGISVDATLHYMFAYDDARRAGKSHVRALCQVHRDVGQALTLATAALAAGFSALVISTFIPTVYFGAMAALSMAGGLAGNLVWLPLVLHWGRRRGS